MNYDSYTPRGMTFARAAIALAVADTDGAPEAVRYAEDRWGRKSAAANVVKGFRIMKSAVEGGGTGSGEWGSELVADGRQSEAEFVELVTPLSAFGRMQDGFRHGPVRTPFVATSSGATAFWRSEGKASPVSSLAFARTSMVPLSLAALVVLSNELVRDSSPEAERLILQDMARAMASLIDSSFLDSTNAGIANKMPAAVTYGAISLASTGTLADDLEAAIGAFSGSLATSSWIMHPRLAASLGIRAGGRGVAADLGARGGQLAGLPAIVSESCTLDSDGVGDIVLIDAASVCVVDDGVSAARSTQGTVEVDDSPTGDTTTPAASSAYPVSLFQTESTGLLLTRRINWHLARQSSVVVTSGAGYYTAS